jgi:DNA-binding response OmpR family regulator
MLTAKGQKDDRRQSLEAGADEYVTKPFSPSRALERVRAALSEPQGRGKS